MGSKCIDGTSERCSNPELETVGVKQSLRELAHCAANCTNGNAELFKSAGIEVFNNMEFEPESE